MKVNWKRAFNYGIVLWVVAFIVASILVAFNMGEGYLSWIIITVIIAVVGFKFAKKLGFSNMSAALSTGLLWVIIVLLLDLIITARFTTMALFSDYKIWISYAIILLIPVFALKKSEKKTDAPTPPSTENSPSTDANY